MTTVPSRQAVGACAAQICRPDSCTLWGCRYLCLLPGDLAKLLSSISLSLVVSIRAGWNLNFTSIQVNQSRR
ncbi:hypothetical protein RRG08_046753 [Elysia crispata]|uniref:Uncharacterized protein n=1 Tax=Elysia crispata TaxID=231223 RepID=A0AAE1DME2_9GAST|nr:hypothetical protein RRG08_046753 [Elysia crispata]